MWLQKKKMNVTFLVISCLVLDKMVQIQKFSKLDFIASGLPNELEIKHDLFLHINCL